MRLQFDQLAKSILDKLLRSVGTVHPQHEVRGTVQAVDIWFEPHPGHAAERARMDAWERQIASPLLFAFRITLPAGVDLYGLDEEAMEYTEKLEQIYADWERQTRQQGVELGLESGFKRGIIRLYEEHFGAMPDDLRDALARVHDESALLNLLVIVGTRPHEAVAAIHEAANAA